MGRHVGSLNVTVAEVRSCEPRDAPTRHNRDQSIAAAPGISPV